MKNKNILITLLCTLGLTFFSGCKKYLEVHSDTQKQVSNSFKTIEDLRATTAFLYATPWNKFNDYARTITEGRANNVYVDGVTGTISALALFAENSNFNELFQTWGSLYVAVTQADYIINDYVPLSITNGVDATRAKGCEGEARFIRGYSYWYLAMLWHDVPIIDDPRQYVLNTLVPPNSFEDVLQYAINDLTIAAQTLPATDSKGRVTKYSAEAMLARILLTGADYAMGGRFSSDYLKRNGVSSNAEMAQKYFDLAKQSCLDVINLSSYRMLDNYEDIWKVQTNNNAEVLFGYQFLPGAADYGLGNVLNNLSFNGDVTGNLTGGSNVFISYDLLRLLVQDGAQSRLRGNVFIPGQNYAYLGTQLAAGSFTVPSNSKTKCNIKKFVVGSNKDTDGAAVAGNSGLVSPALRMSEVYLMYAEAIMGTATQTSDATALENFNKVRKRAFYLNPTGYQPYTLVTRNDLLLERRKELFYEMTYWPDLVRRSFYDMDWTLNFLNNKLKDSDPTTNFTNYASYSYTYDLPRFPNTAGWDNSPRVQAGYISQQVVHNLPAGSYVHAIGSKSNIWALPYPAAEINSDPNLNGAPVPYKF